MNGRESRVGKSLKSNFPTAKMGSQKMTITRSFETQKSITENCIRNRSANMYLSVIAFLGNFLQKKTHISSPKVSVAITGRLCCDECDWMNHKLTLKISASDDWCALSARMGINARCSCRQVISQILKVEPAATAPEGELRIICQLSRHH